MICFFCSTIKASYNFKSAKYKCCSISSRCLNEAKMKNLKVEIDNYFKNFDLSLVLDVNERWRLIKYDILICLGKTAPVKQVNVRITKNLPWYDRKLVNLAHKRNRLYNIWCKTKTASDRENYVNAYLPMIRRC